jgi:hypothetical protein
MLHQLGARSDQGERPDPIVDGFDILFIEVGKAELDDIAVPEGCCTVPSRSNSSCVLDLDRRSDLGAKIDGWIEFGSASAGRNRS